MKVRVYQLWSPGLPTLKIQGWVPPQSAPIHKATNNSPTIQTKDLDYTATTSLYGFLLSFVQLPLPWFAPFSLGPDHRSTNNMTTVAVGTPQSQAHISIVQVCSTCQLELETHKYTTVWCKYTTCTK